MEGGKHTEPKCAINDMETNTLKYSSKRIISFLLCLVMIFGMMPTQVSALTQLGNDATFANSEITSWAKANIKEFDNWDVDSENVLFKEGHSSIKNHWAYSAGTLDKVINNGTVLGLETDGKKVLPLDSKITGKDALGITLIFSFGSSTPRTVNSKKRSDVYTNAADLFAQKTSVERSVAGSVSSSRTR